MPALSQPASEFWNTIANGALVLGAIVVLAGTWGAFWTSNMKEFYADERLSANERETVRAKESAADADLQIEELRKSNLKLSIKFEETRVVTQRVDDRTAPRLLDATQIAAIKSAIDELSAKPSALIIHLNYN